MRFTQKQLIEEGFLDGIRAAGSAVRKGLEAIDPEAKKMFAPIDALKGVASGVKGVYKAFASGDPAVNIARNYIEERFIKQGTMLNLKYLSQSRGDLTGRIIPLSQKEVVETEPDTEVSSLSGSSVENVVEVVDIRGLEDSNWGDAAARAYSGSSTGTRQTVPIKESDYPFRFVFFEADVDTAIDLFNRQTYSTRRLKTKGGSFKREVFGVKLAKAPKDKDGREWQVIGITDKDGNVPQPNGGEIKQRQQRATSAGVSLDDEMALLTPENTLTQKQLIEGIATLFNRNS